MPRSLISVQLLHRWPYPACQEHRVSGHTAASPIRVYRPRGRQAALQEGRRHPIDELAGDLGLITEKDACGYRSGIDRDEAPAKRRALAPPIIRVDHDPNGAFAGKDERLPNLGGAVAENDDDLIETRSAGFVQDMLQQRSAREPQELLWPTHPHRGAGRQYDAGQKRADLALSRPHGSGPAFP
jgi:hypothetical protein